MRGGLSDLQRGPSLISPLVDVIFNAMGAIFTFLMIYIAVVRPATRTSDLRILNEILPDGVWSEPYEAAVVTTGGVGELRFEILDGSLPPGLMLDDRTGRIFGNPLPPPGQSGRGASHEIVVGVRDEVDHRVRGSLPLDIRPSSHPFDPDQQPLRAERDVEQLPRAWVGEPYETALAVLGGIEPYAITLLGQLPDGIRLVETRLSGVPVKSGRFAFRVRVRDQTDRYGVVEKAGGAPPVEQGFVLVVDEAGPLRADSVVPDGRVGEDYRGAFAATGGVPPYEWTLSAVDLPEGLRAVPSANGALLVIAGRAAAAGPVRLDAAVTDRRGDTVDASARAGILAARPPFAIENSSLPAARAGIAYEAGLSATGGVEPLSWRIDDGELPKGIELRGSLLTGAPSGIGFHRFRLVARDAIGRERATELSLSVDPTPRPLEFPLR